MSMESLLAQDHVTILRPVVVKDASGAATRPTHPIIASNVPARVNVLSSAQINAWAQLAIEADYEVQTKQTGILDGDLIQASDGRILRVQGIKKRMRMGGLVGYHVFPCQEIKGFRVP